MIAVISAAFGVVGFFISLIVLYKTAIAGVSIRGIPSVVIVLLFDCVVVFLAWLLLDDHKLAKKGQFCRGIVVDASLRGVYSFGVVYDFLDHSGRVVRGGSLRRVFTGNWDNFFGAGSHVPIVYLPEDPSRNSLYASMAWTVDVGF
jgi:hypothetical protein